MGEKLEPDARRPLASRQTKWAAALTAGLLRTPVTPNQISIASIVFAALGAWALIAAGESVWLYLAAAASVQLRLLCNLLDGLVAVEGGRGSPAGGLYNEVPDRVADSLLIVAMGYAAGLDWLGWLAALLAACTAYIRVLGGSLGLPQDFRGPMAKPHRMAVLTLACVAALAEALTLETGYALKAGLVLIAAGSLVTCATRLRAIGRSLRA